MSVSQLYLVCFNLLSMVGWSYVAFLTIQEVASKGFWLAHENLYEIVHQPLLAVQTLALMECVHSITGLVRSPLITSLLQVSSRLFVAWGICFLAPPSRSQWGFTLMVLSWALTEIPRYSFYALNLVSSVPFPLTWLRYSTFIFLYPSGVSGEIFCLLASLDFLRKSQHFNVEMPNAINFSFNYVNFLQFILYVVYPPGSWILYSYMIKQRTKVLAGDKKQKAA